MWLESSTVSCGSHLHIRPHPAKITLKIKFNFCYRKLENINIKKRFTKKNFPKSMPSYEKKKGDKFTLQETKQWKGKKGLEDKRDIRLVFHFPEAPLFSSEPNRRCSTNMGLFFFLSLYYHLPFYMLPLSSLVMRTTVGDSKPYVGSNPRKLHQQNSTYVYQWRAEEIKDGQKWYG